MKNILFKGKRYILLDGGAITTLDKLSKFEPSDAHIFGTQIKNRGEVIGTTNEIQYIDEVDSKEQIKALEKGADLMLASEEGHNA